MNYKNKFESISFLSKSEKRELIELFISASSSFFIGFKDLLNRNETENLKKLCHNYGSSLIAFNLDECSLILYEIINELKLGNFEKSYALFLSVEAEINQFIAYLKNPS